jgi:hypothetical protein
MREALFVAAALAALTGCAAAGPDHAAAVTRASVVPLVNPGFESAKPGLFGNPEGWVSNQHAGPLSYTFKRDPGVRRGGVASVRIDNVGPEPFGSIYQQIPAASLRGKTVRLSAWIKTKDVAGSATGGGGVLLLQAMRGGAPIAYDHMSATPLKGTTDWTRREITLAIPAAADQIELGAMLHGPGTLWLDDVEFDVMSR